MEGILQIELVYPNMAPILHFREKNLITTAAKLFLLSGIYLPNIVSDPIVALEVGTGGTVDPAGLYPLAESPTQTALHTYLLSTPTTYVPPVGVTAVTFLADLDQNTGNGSMLTECAMVKASGLLFNVKNYPGINKTSSFSVHYSWTIQFL